MESVIRPALVYLLLLLLRLTGKRTLAQIMYKGRVDEGDVLDAAREKYGLERMDQIRHAILERDGEISIIPRR